MRFTREEFDIMASQMLEQKPISYEMLTQIAEKTLRSTVKNWCASDLCLRGRGYEDDIMQEIHIRLIKTTVPYFLRRNGVTEGFNNDPEGFEDWMFRVAENLKKDFANKVRGLDFKTEDLDAPQVESLTASYDHHEDAQEREALLKEAFSIVLSADVNIYKVLTWLAQCLFMLEHNVTKIESNDLILAAFSDKTLQDMYDMLLCASPAISWLVITDEQDAAIRAALRKKRDGTVTFGETQYSAFFMKHKGVVSGKKSISDWMNRMNDMIRRKLEEAPDSGKTQKNPKDNGGKKGRGGDEASNC